METSDGLSYVAVTRTTTANNLAFYDKISDDRFTQKLKRAPGFAERVREEIRLEGLAKKQDILAKRDQNGAE